jgi:two-component system, NarL family, nitrate/nitrite response regulator NarL
MPSFDYQRLRKESTMTSPRTVLIEANGLFRQGLKHLLGDSCFAVMAEFGTIKQALAGVPGCGLVIVGDARQAAGDLHRLQGAYPNAHIVVLASEISVDALREVMNTGADGFLMKDVSPEALIQSLELVLLGEKVFPTNLASMLLDLSSTPSPLNSIRGVSPRENEILQALVTGASNKVIAYKLGITEATVKVHLKTLLRKINVNNRTQAAIWAMNNGFTADGAPVPTLHAVAV